MTLLLTQSELQTFMRDRREWYLGHYRRLRRRNDLPSLPNIGNLCHSGLEGYYGKGLDPLEVVKERATKLIEQHPDFAEQIADDAGMAGIMLEGYLEWLDETGADIGLKVYAAEEVVEVALTGTPFRIRGKIDARAFREFDGMHVQLEHKTVGSLLDIPKTAQSNFQFLTYDLLAKLKALESGDEGYETAAVIVNMLRRVKRTARAKPPFYGRHVVHHNEHELRSHFRHVVGIAQEIERTRERLDSGEDHHVVCPPMVTRDSAWRNPFLPAYSLMDDGGDAEGFLAEFYEEHDPDARYATEEDDG